MKKLAILLIAFTFIGCSKEEEKLPQPAVQQVAVVPSVLHQEVNGTVTTDHSYQIKIYEDMGNGNYQNTITNEYKLNDMPFIYQDEINRPFYFEVILHNSSLYSNGGKGNITVNITYKGNQIVFLEADEFTWSENYTSAVYNN